MSHALAIEDYESIKDMVTPDLIQNVRDKISTFSPEQKQLIAVNKEDIYLSFPYQINTIFDKDKGKDKIPLYCFKWKLYLLQFSRSAICRNNNDLLLLTRP